jgi:dihydropteroate synthase
MTTCGETPLYWGTRTYIVGIINTSPDSFSGDGLGDIDMALSRAELMAAEGADIIDVGGESTRPGSQPIPLEEEIKRVIPVLDRLNKRIPLPLSIDTYKLEVAQRALDAGASMINDIWGLKRDSRLAALAAQRGVPIILMSNQRDVSPLHDIVFPDIMSTIMQDLRKSVEKALSMNVPWENIIIDPGPGFGKTPQQNLEVLRRLDELKEFKLPLLLGTSRKSYIGQVLGLPEGDRLEGTAAAIAIGITKGVDMVRVHDVKEMARLCKMADAIIRR